MTIDNFNFSLVEEFGGYNSARDKTTLDKAFLVRGSRNVQKKVSGTIASRCGLKRRGAADSTDAGVKSSFEWETSKGFTRPLRVCNGKLEVESDIVQDGTYVWYELFASGAPTTSLASSLTRFVFSTWWAGSASNYGSEKKDRLVFVRGDDNIFHWSGGLALVSSGTATTITKQGSETWADLGFTAGTAGEKKVIIGGVEYTYTGGEGTTTLTGVSPDASGLNSGDVAIQAVMVSTDEPVADFEADFLVTVNNQLIVFSYSSRAVYISADIDFLDFENSGAHVAGDPDTINLDNQSKGAGVKDGNLYIFAGNSDLYEVELNSPVPVSFTDPVDSGARFVVTKVSKKILPGLNAALGHEFIGNFGDELVWVDQTNQLRSLGSVANISLPRPTHLSLVVKNELSEDDFTGGHMRVIDDTIHITSPNNGRDWMYQIRETMTDTGEVGTERIWQPPQVRGVARFAVIDGVVYGHSNVNPQLYQINDTAQWFDDNPSDEPIPYTCVMRLAYRNMGDTRVGMRYLLGEFDKYYFEGYMPNGVELLVNFYFEYQGSESIQARVINDEDNPAKFWLGTPYPSLGDSSIGDNPLGEGIIPEGGEQEQLPKFRKIVGVTQVDAHEHLVEVYSTSADSRWEILALGPNLVESGKVPANLIG